MTECSSCGARVSPDEHFCGNCGAQLVPSSAELKTVAANAGDVENVPVREGREWATTLDPGDEPLRESAAIAEAHEPSGSLETAVATDIDEAAAPAPAPA